MRKILIGSKEIDKIYNLVNPHKETTDKGWIEVSKLGSGWAAIHVVRVTSTDRNGYTSSYDDIRQTGLGQYQTQLEAIYEAREWAENEGLEFHEPKDE